jgi:WD40 repeat protein
VYAATSLFTKFLHLSLDGLFVLFFMKPSTIMLALLSLTLAQGMTATTFGIDTPIFQVGHRENVNEVAWSPDGTKILSHSSPDHSMRLWDVATGRQIWSVNTSFIQKNLETYTLTTFDWSSDQRHIASTGYNGKVQLWDAETGKLIWTFQGHEEDGQVLRFSPDNRFLLSAAAVSDKTGSQMKLWEVATGKVVRTFKGKLDNPIEASFSKNGIQISVGNSEGGTSLWDVGSGKRISSTAFKPCGGSAKPFHDSGFSPDIRFYAGRCGDSAVITNARTGSVVRTLKMRDDFTKGVGFSRDGNVLALTDLGGYLTLDLRTNSIGKIDDNINSGFTFELNSDGSRIAEGGGYAAEGILVSDVKTQKKIGQLESHPGIIYSLAFSPDGTRFASGSSDRVLRIWDAATRTPLLSLSGHTDEIKSVAFDADGARITSKSPKETIVWDAKFGDKLSVTNEGVKEHAELPEKAFSPNGKLLLEDLGDDKPFRLSEASDGRVLKEFQGFTQIQGFKFTPDSQGFFMAAWFYPLQLWDTQTGTKLRDFDIGYSYDNVVEFSPDGKRFITGGFNQNILMYDVESGRSVWSLFPIDQDEMLAARLGEERRVKNLRDTAEAEKRADEKTNVFAGKVFITFEHYGDMVDNGNLRMLESGEPAKSKVPMPADSSDAVWLRLHNDSPLPIEVPTQSAYFGGRKCFFTFPSGVRMDGLCDGREISVWHGLEDKGGQRIPFGFDFGSSSVLLPKTSAVFAVPRKILTDGNSIVFTFKFQNENEDGKIADFGTARTLKFSETDIAKK